MPTEKYFIYDRPTGEYIGTVFALNAEDAAAIGGIIYENISINVYALSADQIKLEV